MIHSNSLKQHILLLTLGAITVVWMMAGVFTYFDARREIDHMLDAHLAQASTLLVAQASHELEEIQTDPIEHKYSLRVAFQIWQNGEILRLRSANAPDRPFTIQQSGFSDVTSNKQRWRVFSSWDNTHTMLIHVAELSSVRDDLARTIAANMLKPLLLGLPILTILLYWAVTNGLKPLMRLKQEIALREPTNLSPLDTNKSPDEVAPLIEKLNVLFKRIGQTIENERRFTADAAHELRTPVAGIKAQLQVAIGASEETEQNHAMKQAVKGCDRATHLIEQMLMLARLEQLAEESLETCFLNEIAVNTIAEMAPAIIDSGIKIELINQEPIKIRGMPTLIMVLLRNLIDNSVLHTTTGTLVTVEVTNINGSPSISVTDNGPGVSESDLEKISQRFYRTSKSNAGGSGLGLSIVKRIAELHSAKVNFDCAENEHGLKVTVSFPKD